VHKWLLYRMCMLLIRLYSFQLWYFKGVLLYHPLKELKKMQRRDVLWIVGTFCILPSWKVETIASLIPIHFYLDKISNQHHL